MNVVIVPGYNDRVGYLERITDSWPEKYDLEPHIHAFGTTDPAETYDHHWERFLTLIGDLGQTAVIGISFGAGIGARALQEYPEHVNRIVNISGPWRLNDMNPETVEKKYSMLKMSLSAFNPDSLPPERIMTIRPLADNVISTRNVYLEGATNLRVPVIGHALGIVAALSFRAKVISSFLQQ